MAADPWEIDRLDPAGYLKRLGVPARKPSREALAEPPEAHRGPRDALCARAHTAGGAGSG